MAVVAFLVQSMISLFERRHHGVDESIDMTALASEPPVGCSDDVATGHVVCCSQCCDFAYYEEYARII